MARSEARFKGRPLFHPGSLVSQGMPGNHAELIARPPAAGRPGGDRAGLSCHIT